MANYFLLTLDTLAPAGVTIELAGGAVSTANQVLNATIGTTDADTTGYEMKVYGDVDATYDADIQPLVGDSAWIAYSTTQEVKLSATDGAKTVYVVVRDDVGNEASAESDSITLDSTSPVVTVTVGPTPTKISKVTGFEVSEFTFESDEAFVEYKVLLVTSSGSVHDAVTNVAIPETAGSVNMTGTGTFAATTGIDCEITGTDLETAATADGEYTIKVFVKDATDNWSI